ncbi:MAG: histidinol-phosphate transaminase [Spirochaetes bacterium]|nr:MAG: histidinol-phosphate transaminase [Spirochaetota bacterium]
MNYWNTRLKIMAEYTPGEQPEDIDDFIKLNTNENPFPPSPAVIEALRKACNEKLRRYPNPTAMKVRELFAKQNGLGPENVFVANGSDEIFTLIFRGLIEPDGKAAFAYPSYSLYYTLAEANGIAYEKINLDKNLDVNLPDFLKKKHNLVIIANPNNPTGRGVDVGAIKSFLAKFKGLLVVDEAYVDFYGESAIGLVGQFKNLIVTRTFSKSYSLAGLRVGLAISQPGIIDGLIKLKDSYNVDRLAEAGALAALADTRSLKANMQMVRDNKEFLEEKLAGLGFIVVPSKSNFLFVKHPKTGAKQIYEGLKERRILVRYFSGPVQSEYVRISVGTMMEIRTLVKELSSMVSA